MFLTNFRKDRIDIFKEGIKQCPNFDIRIEELAYDTHGNVLDSYSALYSDKNNLTHF